MLLWLVLGLEEAHDHGPPPAQASNSVLYPRAMVPVTHNLEVKLGGAMLTLQPNARPWDGILFFY